MLTEISKADYDTFNPIFRVIVDAHPRRFGRVVLPDASNPVVMCWHSDSLQPLIATDPRTSRTWIGIDQRLVCLSSDGRIAFSIGLDSNFLQIRFSRDVVAVLTETQAIVINQDLSIRRIIGLRELPEAAELDGGVLSVTFIDGEMATFPIG